MTMPERFKITTETEWGEYGLIAAGLIEPAAPYIEPPAPDPQPPAAPQWVAPVENSADWYCAVWHDQTGAKNNGYKHTGIDLNLDRAPYGDVERGFPVLSIGHGTIHATGYSGGWLGVCVVRYEWQGAPLYVRYAHLDSIPHKIGGDVAPGDVIGKIANWQGGDGGDHLHLDMNTAPFTWSAWLTGPGWIDPVPVLCGMLGDAAVDAMLKRGK